MGNSKEPSGSDSGVLADSSDDLLGGAPVRKEERKDIPVGEAEKPPAKQGPWAQSPRAPSDSDAFRSPASFAADVERKEPAAKPEQPPIKAALADPKPPTPPAPVKKEAKKPATVNPPTQKKQRSSGSLPSAKRRDSNGVPADKKWEDDPHLFRVDTFCQYLSTLPDDQMDKVIGHINALLNVDLKRRKQGSIYIESRTLAPALKVKYPHSVDTLKSFVQALEGLMGENNPLVNYDLPPLQQTVVATQPSTSLPPPPPAGTENPTPPPVPGGELLFKLRKGAKHVKEQASEAMQNRYVRVAVAGSALLVAYVGGVLTGTRISKPEKPTKPGHVAVATLDPVKPEQRTSTNPPALPETPVEKPIEKPVEKPIEKPVEKPASLTHQEVVLGYFDHASRTLSDKDALKALSDARERYAGGDLQQASAILKQAAKDLPDSANTLNDVRREVYADMAEAAGEKEIAGALRNFVHYRASPIMPEGNAEPIDENLASAEGKRLELYHKAVGAMLRNSIPQESIGQIEAIEKGMKLTAGKQWHGFDDKTIAGRHHCKEGLESWTAQKAAARNR